MLERTKSSSHCYIVIDEQCCLMAVEEMFRRRRKNVKTLTKKHSDLFITDSDCRNLEQSWTLIVDPVIRWGARGEVPLPGFAYSGVEARK